MTAPNEINLLGTLTLVRAAQGGDRVSLEELFARYAPRVRRIVALRLGMAVRDLATHEDIVQEALCRAFTGLGDFAQPSVGAFRNWLARCVESAIVDRARRRKAQKRGAGRERAFSEQAPEALASSLFAAEGPSPSTIAAQRESEAELERALLALEPRHREVLVLHSLCGLAHEEVAAAMGISQAATARQIHSRALKKLRELLGER